MKGLAEALAVVVLAALGCSLHGCGCDEDEAQQCFQQFDAMVDLGTLDRCTFFKVLTGCVEESGCCAGKVDDEDGDHVDVRLMLARRAFSSCEADNPCDDQSGQYRAYEENFGEYKLQQCLWTAAEDWHSRINVGVIIAMLMSVLLTFVAPLPLCLWRGQPSKKTAALVAAVSLVGQITPLIAAISSTDAYAADESICYKRRHGPFHITIGYMHPDTREDSHLADALVAAYLSFGGLLALALGGAAQCVACVMCCPPESLGRALGAGSETPRPAIIGNRAGPVDPGGAEDRAKLQKELQEATAKATELAQRLQSMPSDTAAPPTDVESI